MAHREHQPQQLLAAALGFALLAGCNPGPGARNESQPLNQAARPATNAGTPDESGNRFVIPEGDAVGRQLQPARPGTPEAALDTVHQAVAYVQTGRFDALRPLLAPALAARLDKAGGAALLRRWQAARIEFPQQTGMRLDGDAITIPVRLHAAPDLPDGAPGDVRLVKTLVDSRTIWKITDVNTPSKE